MKWRKTFGPILPDPIKISAKCKAVILLFSIILYPISQRVRHGACTLAFGILLG